MAPTPVSEELSAEPSSTARPQQGYWTRANIAATVVFAILALGVVLALLLFYLHRRAEEKKKSKHRRSDFAGLLDKDKSSMFSRQRESSITLYVDSEADAHNKRASTDTMSLVPLQRTPVEEMRDHVGSNTNTDNSTGSGVSAMSGTSDASTMSSMLLSPIIGATTPNAEEGDLGVRPTGRPRSTSSASQKARYYESTPMNVDMPPIPKIVRIPSDEEMRQR
ncbi:hypothetical protein ACN47E_010108 [Coniothyrium glycines]